MPHDDFATEASPGLAKELPPGERQLWQGRPRAWALAREAMAIRWVIGYFAFLAVWRGIALGGTESVSAGIGAAVFYVLGGTAAAALILGLAWVLARTTVYTITTSRVVMRIGAALVVSFNLPFRHIAGADLGPCEDGTGSIHLKLMPGNKLSYLVLWPHVRPWAIRAPEPSLRAIPDAERVAGILARAAEDAVPQVQAEFDARRAPEAQAPRPAPAAGPAPVPAE